MSIELHWTDCLEGLTCLKNETVDLVVTSPPYDSLRNYNNTLSWNFEIFKNVATELYRVVKTGGVIIWVVSDSTVEGSESGTSFKQALFFKEIGFNLHDTMLFRKINYVPLTHNRYEQEFEYMFCFSKSKPKTFNPLKVPCKFAGQEKNRSFYKTSADTLVNVARSTVKSEKQKGNIFEYVVGSKITGKWKHPAMFPLALAEDQIKTWSNKGDLVVDPFLGSGTTALAAKNLGRNFIGFEKEKEYFDIAKQRILTEGIQELPEVDFVEYAFS